MVNATIDNQPISIQLGINESTTVPTNQTWKVALSVSAGGLDTVRAKASIMINSLNVIGIHGNQSNGANQSPTINDVVLTGGDEISLAGSPDGQRKPGCMIQGFVVDS